MDIISRLELVIDANPAKPAFIFFSSQTKRWETVTFQGLADSIQRCTSGLSSLRSNSGHACRITPGMSAALMTPPSADFFALAFALLKLGIVPIIIDPAIGLRKVTECLEESKPDIFIGNPLTHALRVIFGWGKRSIKHNLTIDKVKDRKLKVEGQGSKVEFQILNSSPAAIIYTSGSTGLPKGALYTHANLAAQLDMFTDTFNISPDEIDLPAFPLYALIDALLGITSVIPDITFPVPGKTNPQKVIDAIQQFRVTNMFASPVVLDILSSFAFPNAHRDNVSGGAFFAPQSKRLTALRLRTSQSTLSSSLRANLPSLKRVITAGAPATVQLQENFRKLLDDKTDLFGIYGATEVLPIAKIESREIFGDTQYKSARGAGVCLGKPVNGAKVRIIRISDSAIQRWDDSLEVETNVVGEITIQGAAVTESYIGRTEANQLAKIKDGGDVIHRMGDVGYFDEQGRLWYCGRKSHRVTTSDDVMFTEQIEGIFNVNPLVYRTALVGVNGVPVLWVELKKGIRANKDKIRCELIELAKGHPQASKVKDFLFMKKFPTDVRHNSKIIREELTLLAEKRLA
jgi:acyl-CoA synthetase (AMP-forming)/AMP-acid ligase II